MSQDLQVTLLGELAVTWQGRELSLPASRKARALLAYLVLTQRPHRRERLCELFWDLPDDPKAALRWSLTKLRKVVDRPDRPRILADRLRVHFDSQDVGIDIRDIGLRLRESRLSLKELESMFRQLDRVLLDGLGGAGGESYDSWLRAERADAAAARIEVLRRLAGHEEVSGPTGAKWLQLWREADPSQTEPAVLPSVKAVVAPAHMHGFAPKPQADSAGEEGSKAGRRPTGLTNGRGRALRQQRIAFCQARDGTKIAYATIGSGPPLLKAANWLNHLEYDWSSPIWGRSFATIARFRSFIRYDERGCGLSDWEVADLSFEAFVEDLEAVADKLGLERFPLLGISQGCAVSIEYAVRHPERVSGLILISGYAAGWRHLASPEEQARREAVMALTEVGWGTDNPAYRHIFSQTFMPDADSEALAWFDAFQRQTTSPGNAARFQDAFGRIDVRERLAAVRAPTIVLHSRYDQRIPLELGRAMASGIPDAHFVPLESRNHILVDQEPAWRVCIEAIAKFLADKGL